MCPDCEISHSTSECLRESILVEIESAIARLKDMVAFPVRVIQSTSLSSTSYTTSNVPGHLHTINYSNSGSTPANIYSQTPPVIHYTATRESDIIAVLAQMRDNIKKLKIDSSTKKG